MLLPRLSLILMLILTINGCAIGSGPALGLTAEGKLETCPSSPNCVSSDASDDGHAIAALDIVGEPEVAWQALVEFVEAQPRLTVVDQKPDYLRLEARTRLLRFVDDVEFHLRAGERQIAMRSASRIGYSDLGTNRRRLESVRQALAERGVVAGSS